MIGRIVLRLASSAFLLIPTIAEAQDKNQIRATFKNSAAQWRAVGEPKDRCSNRAEISGDNVVSRAFSGSAFRPGDHLLSINGADMAGKHPEDAVAVLRNTAPNAIIPATVSRNGAKVQVQVVCTNSRPRAEKFILALDQGAAGKFDECAVTATAPDRFSEAMVKATCLSLEHKRDDRALGEATFDAMKFAIEDADYVPSSRSQVADQLRSVQSTIVQGLGQDQFDLLVSRTRQWPGDESLFRTSEPDWAKFRANGDAALRARLIDPDSAHIQWPHGFTYGTWKPLLSKRIEGYWTCGLVNARNRMGGYTGTTAFVVVMDRGGRLLFADIGSSSDADILSTQCAKSVSNLPLPPPALREGTRSSEGLTSLGDELKKLADLKASGALSETEFEAAKQKLIGSSR